MNRATPALLSLVCALGSAASPRVAHSEAPTPAAPPPALALSAEAPAPSDKPSVDAIAVPGSSIERMRATVAVNAPIDRVRAVVFDFPRYPDFMPHYRRGLIERRSPSGSFEVRLDMEELAGAVHVWVRVEIPVAERAGATERYKGRLLAGSVKAFEPRWELESLGPSKTRLMVESFMDPDLPLVPSSLVNSGARERIRDVILALKARAESR
ncbi:MAG: SRPBCC family protein [Byssovorax sp.]